MKRIVMLFGVIFTLMLITVIPLASCRDDTSTESSMNTCTECHNNTTLVLAQSLQWQQSLHATGGAYVRSSSASCAGCHSSEGFTKMIDMGISPAQVAEGETNPTPPNCRTCHIIHTSYTLDDFALKTTEPVTLFISGEKFDFGKGNLCANCHQPRRAGPSVGDGDIEVDSTRWGPHHGPQTTSFLGIGGYGVAGSVTRPHYESVSNGCPQCHMVNDRHEMAPSIASCEVCHSGIKSFDYNGVQTDIKAKLEELRSLLEEKGLLKDGQPVVGTYPEEQAGALWNYISVVEDGSLGVHNYDYFKALLEASIDALK